MITETRVSDNYYSFSVPVKEGKTYYYVWYNNALRHHSTLGRIATQGVTTLTQARQGILQDLQRRYLTAHVALTDLQDTINTLKEMTNDNHGV